jgi:hypothetical protein
MLWFSSGRFPPDVGEVSTIYVVSIVHVLYSDRTVGQKFFIHHCTDLPLSGVCNHPLNPPGFPHLLDFFTGVPFKVPSHSIHEHQTNVALIIGHVVVVQSSFTWLEFNNPILGVNLEYSSTIPAIVRHPVTILGLMEGKHINYASWVVLDGQRSKISFKTAVSRSCVAVDGHCLFCLPDV